MKKTVTGILALVPFLLAVACIICLAVYGINYGFSGSIAPGAEGMMANVIRMVVVLFLFGWVASIVFIVLTVMSNKLTGKQKIIWACVIYIFSVFACPVFWVTCIVRERA